MMFKLFHFIFIWCPSLEPFSKPQRTIFKTPTKAKEDYAIPQSNQTLSIQNYLKNQHQPMLTFVNQFSNHQDSSKIPKLKEVI